MVKQIVVLREVVAVEDELRQHAFEVRPDRVPGGAAGALAKEQSGAQQGMHGEISEVTLVVDARELDEKIKTHHFERLAHELARPIEISFERQVRERVAVETTIRPPHCEPPI